MVGLAPCRQWARDVGPVGPFGLSWPQAVSLRRPPRMSVGFPWISLDSLVRIETFQWVTRLEAGEVFSRAFSLALRGARTGARGFGMGKRRIIAQLFMPKLNLFSDFLQAIVVRAVPFRPPQSKSSSL